MRWSFATLVLVIALVRDSGAKRPLPEYRYFRALSIDLIGRPPTRTELQAFERPDFQLDAWIDGQLGSGSYVERIRRVYTDLLRLDLPENASVFKPPSVLLRQTQIQGPDGRMIDLYFRHGQRRVKAELDGWVCFTPDETGLHVGWDGPPTGSAKPVNRRLLDERTVVVRPWWLYADYRSPNPRDRASEQWLDSFGYERLWSLFVEPDGTPQTGIRVCREEAQTAPQGRVFVAGRTFKKGDPIAAGRVMRPPSDSAYAKANAGRPIACTTHLGFESSAECGCGVGLERCVPTGPNGFVMPWQTPLGIDQAFDKSPRPAILWHRAWWVEEANHFIDRIVREDRDVREMLTSRATVVNGPLAQFYRFLANATCCGAEAEELGYTQPVPLFDPAAVPASLAPYEVSRWTTVEDRGPQAAGLMTMPIFLLKYGSQRQRAHAVYSTFLCREFVAENVSLKPSNEPDLTKREGCAACHKKLEPMSAYFARIKESDWTYLPPASFPVSAPRCVGDPARWPAGCRHYYDPDFTTASSTVLRNAYAAPAHADLGPAGFATEITSSSEFAPCVVRNVAQSLLGRQLGPEDATWRASLAEDFVRGGFRMRGLVRAILRSGQYRETSDRVTP